MDSKSGSTQLQTLFSFEEFEPMCTWQREDVQDILVLHLQDFKKEQLRIQLSNTGIMKITGEKAVEGKKRRFQKEVKVTSDYDSNNIHAKFSQGYLRITLPKRVVKSPMPEPATVTSLTQDSQNDIANINENLSVLDIKTRVGQVLRSKEFTRVMVNIGFVAVVVFSVYTAYRYWTLYIQVDED